MSVYTDRVIRRERLLWHLPRERIYFRTSRGGSGALYSQSAIVRVMLAFDAGLGGLPFGSGVEILVLRNISL